MGSSNKPMYPAPASHIGRDVMFHKIRYGLCIRNWSRLRIAIGILEDLETDGYTDMSWVRDVTNGFGDWKLALEHQIKQIENED
jgi:hypothetical protein